MTTETMTTLSTSLPAVFVNAANAPLLKTKDAPNCVVCGSTQFHTHARGYDYELQTCRNEWKFVCCDKCDHVWLNPFPSPEQLATIYPKHYYAYNYDKQFNWIATKGKEIIDSFKFDWMIRKLPRAPKTFLDIGCANGRFLKLLEKRGVTKQNNYGIDLTEKVVNQLATEGYQTSCARVEDANHLPNNFFDFITIFHVLEHVESPAEVARQIHKWLAPNGVVAIEMPNIKSWDANLFQKSFWGGYHIPRHWHLFHPETLEKLMKEQGFEVISVRFEPGHSCWLFSIYHALRNGKKDRPRLAKLFNPFEGAIALPMLVAFTFLDKVRSLLGFRTSCMLMLARKV